MTDTLITALGLVLIIEGLMPALFPNKWQKYLLTIARQSTSDIRNIGVFILTLGFLVIWLSQ